MLASQIALAILVLIIIYKTFTSYRTKHLSLSFTLLWLTLWLVILFFITYPNLLIKLAHLVGIGRGVDLAIYLSLITVFFLVYKIFLRLTLIEKDLTQISRKIALNTPKQKTTKTAKSTR